MIDGAGVPTAHRLHLGPNARYFLPCGKLPSEVASVAAGCTFSPRLMTACGGPRGYLHAPALARVSGSWIVDITFVVVVPAACAWGVWLYVQFSAATSAELRRMRNVSVPVHVAGSPVP